MEVKIISKENSAMPRTETVFSVKYTEKTPSRLELKKEFVKQLKSKDELVFVEKILNNYGSKELKATVYAYETEDAMKALEFEKQISKNFPKKEGESNE